VGDKIVHVERGRLPATFPGLKRIPQRPQLSFPILEQSQTGSHHFAGQPVAARTDLLRDEVAEVVINAEARIPSHRSS